MIISKKIKKDIEDYCALNNIENVDDFTLKVLKNGFEIEKYGLLNDSTPKIITNEIIKEIPVIEYVEKPIEVIKEVIVNVPSEDNKNSENQQKLQRTIFDLKNELIVKNKKIIELETIINEFNHKQNNSAIFLKGSNLDNIIK